MDKHAHIHGRYQRRMRPLLGTFVEICAPENEINFETAVGPAFQQIEKVQNLLSRHDSKSELSALNQIFDQPLSLDPKSILALKLARFMAVKTQGIFDSSLSSEQGSLKDLKIRGRRVFSKKPLKISLDGIAKGFAVDCAVKILKKQGLKAGWINAGGDLRMFGDLEVPLHLRNSKNELEFLGNFKNTAIATSAVQEDVERFPGKIVDPRDPARILQQGVFTVQAPAAWVADALTKVLALVSSHQAEKILQQFGAKMIQRSGHSQ